MKTVESAPSARPAAMKTSFLRLGLIGCGERGAMLAAETAKTRNTRLAMVMDASPDLARDLGQRFEVPWTTDLDGLLSNEQVETVIISTPHFLHATQAIRAAQAGKHIMVEKPMATSLQEAVGAVRAARAAGVAISNILPYRYQPRVLTAKSLIDAGAIGELFGVSLIYQEDKFADYWQRGHKGRTTSDWRMRWETSGGGVLITSVIHHLDWLRYLPSLEVAEVSARYSTMDSPGAVEDTISLCLRYVNGAIGTVNASSCVRGADLVEFRFWGRDGHISLTPPYQYYSLRLVNGKRPGQWHEFTGPRGVAGRDVEYLQRFADRVQRGEAPEITAEDGLAVQAIVDAAYRSGQSGRAEPVSHGPW